MPYSTFALLEPALSIILSTISSSTPTRSGRNVLLSEVKPSRAGLVSGWVTDKYGVGNLVPRSPKVMRKGDLVKFDFEHAQCQRGPKIRAFVSLRMFVLSVVILGDFAEYTWISRVFLKRFFLVEDEETLNLIPNRKKH